MIVGYQRERIESHFGDGSAFGVAIAYREQTVPTAPPGRSCSRATRRRAARSCSVGVTS